MIGKLSSLLGEKLKPLLPQVPAIGEVVDRLKVVAAEPRRIIAPVAPGTFINKSYTNDAGTRPYKLFTPSGYVGDAVPLVVMLHGCTQSPDDFAAGTRMNELAEEQCFLVAYPAQVGSANAAKCWNWFNASDQMRERGEPSLVAGIAREIAREYAVDPTRVYVAGLSAGAAAAAVLGDAYPDLFAAVGVHSGLPPGVAKNLPSALAAMRNGAAAYPRRLDASAERRPPVVPTIVFHGDRDTTVHPSNGDAIVSRYDVRALSETIHDDRVPSGHAYRRIVHGDVGRPVLEQWIVRGAGHAWFGGSKAGSYTDPLGPDASREMVRFFMKHARATAAPTRTSEGAAIIR